ncbi:aromatic ring-hydroxylating oxygenase subunit alpha [Acuticoccus mangrovi]|uniref:Aromatic ring-hydroxylating dioxygenase subunit alpha n=1 Tax=Acuticoccus mangrovi TaxID=2796142 RepID=A0A934MGD9_9HYPH|nr:aromatic ring-hydroxylating dioxygenase subunit alpha [Acuticoccus mangrovi]MBJ3776473.1 aromatic ring-hydroxylating dioxygenase subunit alpha [Acuticoccus mangrovi]
MPTPADVLDPAHFSKVRLPLDEAETLPAWCYVSEAFYQYEVERLFMKVWNFIGRADHIPNPGDYFTLTFVGVPLIIVRDRAGELRAFSNSCRHRGARVAEGEGNARAFVCPYHGWAYGLDGSLVAAPEMDLTKDFDTACNGLKPVRLETWAGFLFINFDPDAERLMDYLGDLPERLASYHFETMKQTFRREYILDCNWKIYAENAMEAYHVPMVHAKTLQKLKREMPPKVPSEGNWVGLHTKHTGSRALLAGDTGFPPIPTLDGLAGQGTYYTLTYPSTMFGCTIDCMWWFEVHPLGPEKMRLIVGGCFPEDITTRPDFEEVAQRYYKRWQISVGEDNDISEIQQIGIRSPLAVPGRLSYLEPLVHDIANWVLDHVLDEPTASEAVLAKAS